MIQFINIALCGHAFRVFQFIGINTVPDTGAPCAGAASTQRTAIHLSRVIEPLK